MNTTDLSKTIAPKSDQLNADDLISGPKTITITDVRGTETSEQPINIFYEGDGGKPYKPCKSMRRVMVRLWGKDGKAYAGRSMTLFCDPAVMFGGIQVGGIRISHMSGLKGTETLSLTVSKARRAPFVVKPLEDVPKGGVSMLSQDEALEQARAAAGKGKDAFVAFWNGVDGKSHRDFLKPHIDELQGLVAEADAAKGADEFARDLAGESDDA